jgi:thermostable 8-oxoguanine DNA glycosylase
VSARTQTTVSGAHVQPVSFDWAALWYEFGGEYVERVTTRARESPSSIEDELLFCLLGGHGVTFELARSATAVLEPLNVFGRKWSPSRLEAAIRTELETAQFDPPRKDGSLRRYRYPRRKALVIAQAAQWVKGRRPLYENLWVLDDERARRNVLCECPGIGLKTASWLLRNVGLGDALAVVDVHVLRALAAAGRITDARLPRDYHAVERHFLAWCDELNAPPAAFDLMVWEWQRAVANA